MYATFSLGSSCSSSSMSVETVMGVSSFCIMGYRFLAMTIVITTTVSKGLHIMSVVSVVMYMSITTMLYIVKSLCEISIYP